MSRPRLWLSSSSRARLNEIGATAVEYGLLLALLAGIIIGTVRVLGRAVLNVFNAAVGTF